MKNTLHIALALMVAAPLATVAAAQGNAPSPSERAAREAARSQEEAHRKAQEQTQRARDEAAQKERDLRERAEKAQGDAAKGAAEKNPRALAAELARLETMHRERMARINRLMDVYRESKNTERLKELEQLRGAQEKRYANAIARLKERLGAAEFEKLDRELAPGRKAGGHRASAPKRGDGPAAGKGDDRAAEERERAEKARAEKERAERERAEKERAEKEHKDKEAREKKDKEGK
jgi:hypothetical protein